MKVSWRACGENGWQSMVFNAPDGSDHDCYALPKGSDTRMFWKERAGVDLPNGHAIVWEIISE